MYTKARQYTPSFMKLAMAAFLLLIPFVSFGKTPDEIAAEAANNEAFYWLLFFAILQIIGIMVFSSSVRSMWKERFKVESEREGSNTGKILPVVLFFIGSIWALDANAAPAAEKTYLFYIDDYTVYMMMILNGLLACVNVYFMTLLKQVTRETYPVHIPAKVRVVRESVFARIYKKLTAVVPIEEEGDLLMDHEYDGIQELDNKLPPWWLYGFYLSIVAAFLYMGVYHIWGIGDLQNEAYEKDMIQAELDVQAYLDSKSLNVDERNVRALTGKSNLDKGKAIFTKNCVSCHGELGEGMEGSGPNLTDAYWLHGGDIKQVFTTIKYGQIEKGMKSWRNDLTPIQMQDVASFIFSLQGTNPPNAQPPQGNLYVPVEGDETGEAKTDTLSVLEEL